MPIANKHSQLFSTLTTLPFFKSQLLTLKQIYQSICPYEDKEAEVMATQSLTYGLFAFVVTLILTFLINVMVCGLSVFSLVSPFFAAYYLYTEVLMKKQNDLQAKLSVELSTFFVKVSHYYQSEKSIISAISTAASTLSPDIQIIAKFIIETISSEDAEDLIYNYVTDADKNIYLKLFLQQCYGCFEDGDTIHNGVSSFCETLETFRVDMLRTKTEKQKNNARLQGLSFVIWLPVLAMGIIKNSFGITLTEDMADFYARFGLMVELIGLGVAFFLYRSLNRTKYQHLKTITIHKFYYEIQDRFNLYANIPQGGWLLKLLKEVACNAPPSVVYTKISLDSFLGICLGFSLVFISAVQNNEMILLEHVLLSFAFGLVSVAFPIKVFLLKLQFKKDRESEVDSFQLLMLSEMYSRTITVAELLAKMERLASYYRLAIGECLNSLAYDQTKALLTLKEHAENEDDIPLSNIIDMLISVDRLGIENSFRELKVNRQLGLEERHILSEIKADETKNILELLSSVPAVIAVGVYVMIPFIFYTFRDMGDLLGNLETMGSIF